MTSPVCCDLKGEATSWPARIILRDCRHSGWCQELLLHLGDQQLVPPWQKVGTDPKPVLGWLGCVFTPSHSTREKEPLDSTISVKLYQAKGGRGSLS